MKICFSGKIYSSAIGKMTGGAEGQIWLIAKYLSLFNHKIYVIDFDIKKDKKIDGISFLSLKSRLSLKFLWSFSFFKLLKNINADIYYCRVRSFHHLIPLYVSKKNNSQIIYHVAHDLETNSFNERLKLDYLNMSFLKSLKKLVHAEIFSNFILNKFSKIIVQNKFQYKFLKRKKFKNIYLIPNVVERNTFHDKNFKLKCKDYFITIGYLNKRKGIENLYKIIKNNLDKNFVIIGRATDNFAKSFLIKIQKFKNVFYFNNLNKEKTMLYLNNSKALLSTSFIEGFPNVFLEAWLYGKPVLSLYINPSGILNDRKLGVFFNDVNKLINDIKKNNYNNLNSSYIKNWVKKNHDPKLIVTKLNKILNK